MLKSFTEAFINNNSSVHIVYHTPFRGFCCVLPSNYQDKMHNPHFWRIQVELKLPHTSSKNIYHCDPIFHHNWRFLCNDHYSQSNHQEILSSEMVLKHKIIQMLVRLSEKVLTNILSLSYMRTMVSYHTENYNHVHQNAAQLKSRNNFNTSFTSSVARQSAKGSISLSGSGF